MNSKKTILLILAVSVVGAFFGIFGAHITQENFNKEMKTKKFIIDKFKTSSNLNIGDPFKRSDMSYYNLPDSLNIDGTPSGIDAIIQSRDKELIVYNIHFYYDWYFNATTVISTKKDTIVSIWNSK